MTKDKLANIAIITGLIIVAVLAGFILTPQRKAQPQSTDITHNLKSYTFDGLTIKTDLSKELAQTLSTFLQSTIKESIIPKEIILTMTEKAKGELGDTHIANWNRDGKHVSVLFGLTKDNTRVNYQRIWSMPMATAITDQKANSLLSELFLEKFLTDITPATCTETALPDEKTITECGKMKTTEDGNLIGVTVRTPVELAPPPGSTPPPGVAPQTVTIVSACFVPKEGTSLYTAPLCI